MLNTASLLMRLHTDLTTPLPRNLTTPSGNLRNGWAIKLQGNVEKFAAEEKTILSDRQNNDVRKASLLEKRATDFLPSAGWMKQVLTDLAAKRAQQEGELQVHEVASPVTNEALRYLRGLEIRTPLRDADQAHRDLYFLKACEQDKREVLAALLDEVGEPLVSAEAKHRGLTARAQRLQPERYAAYRQNQLLIEYLESLRDMTALWLRTLGADPKAIHATLGGTLQANNGTPDGRERATGAAWATAIALNQAVNQ